jgi:hypothetical protein
MLGWFKTPLSTIIEAPYLPPKKLWLSHVKSPYSTGQQGDQNVQNVCIWEAQSLESLARTWQNDQSSFTPKIWDIWDVGCYVFIYK